MRRSVKIQALLDKCRADYLMLDAAYSASRSTEKLGEDVKVLIKNILENLRSCLDYMAHEIFETYCAESKKPKLLYFPIRTTPKEFEVVVEKSFPGLSKSGKAVVDLLQSVQPYKTDWLGQLHKLNNLNKHEDLADHIHVGGRRVTMESDGEIVALGPGIGIAPDAKFFGIPVDPTTLLPVLNDRIKTTVEPWSNFYFDGMFSPVTVFMSDCIRHVEALLKELEALV